MRVGKKRNFCGECEFWKPLINYCTFKKAPRSYFARPCSEFTLREKQFPRAPFNNCYIARPKLSNLDREE